MEHPMQAQPIPAALWLRVSTDEQDSGSQLPDLLQFTAHRGYAEAVRYELDDSAWRDDTGGPLYRATIAQALADAHAGKFKVLIVWALDRITRLGAEDALRLIRQFRERGVTVLSVQEPWLNAAPRLRTCWWRSLAGRRRQRAGARASVSGSAWPSAAPLACR
jgi:DNA invertase Pin-like site-specific DNA recombinase